THRSNCPEKKGRRKPDTFEMPRESSNRLRHSVLLGRWRVRERPLERTAECKRPRAVPESTPNKKTVGWKPRSKAAPHRSAARPPPPRDPSNDAVRTLGRASKRPPMWTKPRPSERFLTLCPCDQKTGKLRP